MDLHQRLHTQWTESAQDWIDADQAVRTGMLDRWMLDSLGDVSGKSAIDIGCGEGRFSRLLSGLGATVTGIDLTGPFIERARSLSTDETYLLGNAETLDGIDNDTYDIAVSYIVLVDLQDFRSAVKAAYRVLRPGGRFVVCNIHPMRSCVEDGWIKQGDTKLFYPVDNYTDEGPRRIQLVRRKIRQHAPHPLQLHQCVPRRRIRLQALREPVPSDED